ncbi:PAS domain-containing sensor histidine kinase [Nisaea sp.]|uniref:sensor histidine kinase n=1 Tax=Nisaea sp. TaxID=2024842 RepID=UPI002B26B842|nr:PAS domain-containing sensor histidine kinase [Nisaea sp.]
MTDLARLRIAEEISDPIVAVARDGRICWLNTAFKDLTGFASVGDEIARWLEPSGCRVGDMLGLARSSTIPMPFRASVKTDNGTEPLKAEHWRLRDADGPVVALRFFSAGQEAARFVALTETIDRLNQEVRSRREAERSLRSAVADLEAANRTKDRILAEVSHDLRTPLNAIIGFSDAMQHGIAGPLTAKQSDYIDSIQQSGNMLLELVELILEVAQDRSEKEEVVDRLVDLDTCISRCVAAVKIAVKDKNVVFLVPDDCLLPRLQAEQATITTILMNLLDNAARFSPPGGHVSVETDRQADGGLTIRVSDQGPGIESDELDRIALPFYRAQASTVANRGGYGLGLSVVDSRLKALNGHFEVHSQIGLGTAVTVHLPADRVHWPPPPDAGSPIPA